MKSRQPTAGLRSLCTLVAVSCTTPVLAASGSEWTISPYLWIASFDGTIGGGGGDSNTGGDARFEHAWENTGLAGAMVNVSWRHDRWTAFGDWTYANVSSASPTRTPALYESIEGQVKGHVVQAFGGYDLLPSETGHLDLFAGVRYYHLDLTVTFAGAAAQTRELNGSDGWADGVAGLRWTARFADHWRTLVQVDLGAGGSNFTWQGYAVGGYQFGWGTLLGGWRYLRTDYGNGSFEMDAALTGPFVGASWTF